MFQSMLMAGLLMFGASESAADSAAQCRYDKVTAYDTNVHTAYFGLAEMAYISVVGDGDTDLDVYVYDPLGNLVAYDTGITDICFVSWWATTSGTYRIEVINYGSVYNLYQICAEASR